MAEKQGFEPWKPVRVYLISSQAPSTTRPLLRGGIFLECPMHCQRLRTGAGVYV